RPHQPTAQPQPAAPWYRRGTRRLVLGRPAGRDQLNDALVLALRGTSRLDLSDSGFRRWAPAQPVSRSDRPPAPGLPGDYPDRTCTGRRRRASDQVMIAGQSPPDALGARNFGLAVTSAE